MLNGIDVYVGDGKIDWAKVKADGIDFAMIKASQGYPVQGSTLSPFTDRNFVKNIEEASAAGIKCGVYHYLMAKTPESARAEAKYFIETVAPYRELVSFPACVDMENDIAKRYLSKEKALNTQILVTFLETVSTAGFKPMVYINPNFIRYLLDFEQLSRYDVWLAYYTTEKQFLKFVKELKNPSQIKIWQYGQRTVDGISDPTDGNFGFFDYEPQVGDVNRDGAVDPLDASLILSYDAGYTSLDDEQKRLGDVNFDGETDPIDASLILRADAGITELSAEHHRND